MTGGEVDATASPFTMTIDGRAAATDRQMTVVNPATRAGFATAPVADEALLDEAVAAAQAATAGWQATAMTVRRSVLHRLADRIDEQCDPLATLLTCEQGKPIRQARDEVTRAAQWLRDMTAFDLPEQVNIDTPERLSVTRYVPIGVVGAIVPWNYPVLLAAWKIAPALLCGNAMIVKPSPYTPLTMLRIGELARGIIPDGILNVVTGDDRLGPWMTAHPGIAKIAFTGSTETGRRVMASGAPTLKRLTLELGGNDAAIVLPDADPVAIVPALFAAAFGNSGQICLATKRLYVHDRLFDQVVAGMADLAKAARIGNGLDSGTTFGPIQNQVQYDRVCGLIADCRARGDVVLGDAIDPAARGYFIPLTIVVEPPDDAPVVTLEAFGPVLPILRYHEIEDVITRTNATPFGLGASIWTADPASAHALAARLQVGTVWINETRFVSPATTLAGHKQSGLGSELGIDGLLAYCQPQTITMRR